VYKNLLTVLCLVPLITIQAKAQSFIGDGFNSAIEAVQEGLDLIWPDNFNIDGIDARLGLGLGSTPDYVGSDNYRVRVVPLVDIRYKDILRLNGSTLTYKALRVGDWAFGPLLNLRLGRPQERNRALQGLGDINTTFEVGAYARFKNKTTSLVVDYRHGTGAGIGSSLRATVAQGIYKKGKFAALIGGRIKWLSEKTTQTDFGLTAEQAGNSALGLSEFDADAGLAAASVNFVGAYSLSEETRLLGITSYGRLFADAKSSPLVAVRGSSSQFIVGVGIIHNF